MNCREFIERIDAFLEQSLPASGQDESEEHLSACPYCTDYLESYREAIRLMREALSTSPDAAVPEDLKKQVLRALQEEPRDDAS